MIPSVRSEGATTEFFLELIIYTLFFPSLECFSGKQLNQSYLQMRPGPYLSLYRGDPPLLNFWSHNRLYESLNGLPLVSLQICTMH